MSVLVRIPVGVVVERRKAMSQWADFIWQPVAVLPDAPDATPWTVLKHDGDRTSFYAGPRDRRIPHHRDVALPGQSRRRTPSFGWCCARPKPPIRPIRSRASPRIRSRARAIPKPATTSWSRFRCRTLIRDALEAFVAEHHVEQTFYKRKRDRPNTEALGRRSRTGEDD